MEVLTLLLESPGSFIGGLILFWLPMSFISRIIRDISRYRNIQKHGWPTKPEEDPS